MAEVIRKIKETDFQEVSDLFRGQKYNGAEDLKWLFADPENFKKYNAFVAVNDENTIIGVIAYVEATYIQNGMEIIGICPMSWMLKSDYKGMAGVSLFREVSKLGDIALAISGEKISQKLYPMFKYKKVAHFDNYYKVLKPITYFKILKKRTFLKKAGMFSLLLPTYFKRNISRNKHLGIEFFPYENNVVEKASKEILKRKMTKEYINWLLECPFLKTEAFSIKIKGELIGVCILYMEKVNNTFKGRIVHLPFLGYDRDIWQSVIGQCVRRLRKNGCCFVSGLAVHDMCKKSFADAGFKTLIRYRESIYLKDNNEKLKEYNIKNWNMQFSEGDIFLRNF